MHRVNRALSMEDLDSALRNSQPQRKETQPAMKACHVPPPGWRCTRPAGHDGPCASVPIDPNDSFNKVLGPPLESMLHTLRWVAGERGERAVLIHRDEAAALLAELDRLTPNGGTNP